MSTRRFLAGMLNGVMGGLLGLGGAALRVPRLGRESAPARHLLRDACGVVVAGAAWVCRAKIVPLDVLATHLDVVALLLAGCLVGASLAIPRAPRWRTVLLLLVLLTVLSVAIVSVPDRACGVVAGAAIGLVMGATSACGLLLVPALVLLYGLDVKVAGSLALMVSLPVLLMGLLREQGAAAFPMLFTERQHFLPVAYGAIVGAALGTLLMALLPSGLLMTLLEVLLVYAALLNFIIFPQFFGAPGGRLFKDNQHGEN